ncbi:10967_t:CDS:1 [Entrophospora sp. SA101]|nr:7225_t:CDS:1 [Entrophospora sp. SA101]CAJ0755340.1 6851_t:CDS:1 [Entrophospora sp. SA101]CAJ0759752.1 18453_t:CDS:1 [Entrophospora sp. SA101]CAJ0763354.1 10967_t:CDS:1 [Entrophospora sp. SA101]CAJ0830902.1 6263_t:CDS:1 [Entrophospora sp. SA101]
MKNLSKAIGAAVLAFSLIVNVDARFGQQNLQDGVLAQMRALPPAGDKSAYTGNLTGAYVRSLLAAAPKCDQQDVCDNFVDMANIIGKEGDAKTQSEMIKLAQQLRQAERNTPNDGQPSAKCDREPRNKELDGLTQNQDPSPNPKNLPPFESPTPKSSEIPTFVQNGKTLIPAESSKSADPPKGDSEMESLIKKIDTTKLSAKDKKMVKKCTKPKSRDRKKCVQQLKKLAKKFPKN